MQALSGGLPSELRSYAGILLRRRRGLRDPGEMPLLAREASGVRVEAGWLAAYRRILEQDDGDPALLPPLALQVAAAPLHLAILGDARFPFPALGLVHVAQEVRLIAPLRAGERFDLRATTTAARAAKRGVEFGLVTEALVDGHTVWRGETTALVPAPRAPGEAKAKGGGEKKEAGAAQFEEPGWTTLAELAVPERLGRRYAAIARDRNPIHQHALLARPFGFRRAIVHGTWTLGRALAAKGLLPAGATVEARFQRPVLLPSRIVVRAREEGSVRHLQVRSADGRAVHLSARLSGAP